MLKAYAVALVIATAAPVADKAAEGLKAPVQNQTATTTSTTADKAVKSRGIRW